VTNIKKSAIKINFEKYESIASAIVVIGLASFVKRETSIETEKKITTVKVAKSAPQKPGKPLDIEATIIEIREKVIEGSKAPRHSAVFEFAIFILITWLVLVDV
jgi:membrane-associated protease RseP (regulator of RpoE activity)